MSLLKVEPTAVRSLDQLLAIASAMESEAIAGYTRLAEHMRREGRQELAEVFDRLVAEEMQHLDNVARWSEEFGGPPPDVVAPQAPVTFDDEGAALVAPELLSAYRAFSMAVRNEERAFLFWTYVASQAPSDELRAAAEEMAREELNHVAILRRERRQAFHSQRRLGTGRSNWTAAALEERLAEQLRLSAASLPDTDRSAWLELADEATGRADIVRAAPFAGSRHAADLPDDVAERPGTVCELLLECYLHLAETLPKETERELAQALAAQVIRCLSALRDVAPV